MRQIVFLLDGVSVEGGAERHTLDLATGLIERGYDVRLVVYSHVENSMQLPSQLADRIKTLEFNRVLDLKGAAAVAAALGSNDLQVVIAVNQASTMLAALARLWGASGSFVSVLHTTVLLPGLWNTRRFWLYRLALLGMHRLVYVSVNQMKYWRERRLFCQSTEAITNGIDTDRFAASNQALRETTRRSLGIGEDDYVVGVCACFRPEKNLVQLVDAAALLHRRGIPVRLLLVGDGETRAAVAAHAQALGLAQDVIFAGSQIDVRPFVAAMDVGVLCSTAVETFSIAALEIMASGRPMILSDIGGASEIVRDGIDGALFAVGDTPALAAALTRFAVPAVRGAAGSAARDSVVARHSHNMMVGRYQAMFDTLTPPSALQRWFHRRRKS